MTTEPRSSLVVRTRRSALAMASVLALSASGCGVRAVDPDSLPADLRSSYALFEVRCSKCHTIARPLNAPIRDATHWELYVTRMRRVPGSGIDERDAREILRFLTYYTEVIRAGQHGGTETSGGATVEDETDAAEPSTEVESDAVVPSGDAEHGESSAERIPSSTPTVEPTSAEAVPGGPDAATE